MVGLFTAFAVVSGAATILATIIALLRVGRTWGARRERTKSRGQRVEENESQIQRIEARLDRVDEAVHEVYEVVSELKDYHENGSGSLADADVDLSRDTGSYSGSRSEKWEDETRDE